MLENAAARGSSRRSAPRASGARSTLVYRTWAIELRAPSAAAQPADVARSVDVTGSYGIDVRLKWTGAPEGVYPSDRASSDCQAGNGSTGGSNASLASAGASRQNRQNRRNSAPRVLRAGEPIHRALKMVAACILNRTRESRSGNSRLFWPAWPNVMEKVGKGHRSA
jgi:hypothetical protein